jgi:hypothetical protein
VVSDTLAANPTKLSGSTGPLADSCRLAKTVLERGSQGSGLRYCSMYFHRFFCQAFMIEIFGLACIHHAHQFAALTKSSTPLGFR